MTLYLSAKTDKIKVTEYTMHERVTNVILIDSAKL
jgi:hypothetical protein